MSLNAAAMRLRDLQLIAERRIRNNTAMGDIKDKGCEAQL
jgi:hypothetical protein